MSRRKRQSAAAITLFSFQDIIMSTSGIMILIVLLLSLELIQKKGTAGSPLESVDTSQILADIERVQSDIETLEMSLESSDQLMQTASLLTETELKEKLINLKNQNSLLTRELEALQSEMRQQEQLEPQLTAMRRQLQDVQRRLSDARSQSAQLKQTIRNVIEQDRPIFTLPRGSQQSGWLVDVSGDQILVAPIGRAMRPIIFSPKAHGIFGSSRADQAFLDWAMAQSSDRAYYFLMVRPQGVEAYQRMAEQFDKNQISYGYDLIGADQVILDPKTGAMQ